MTRGRGDEIPLEQYLADREPEARELFEVVRGAVESVGPATVRATKSQIAFWRDHPFAWVWASSQYLGDRPGFAPLVLTIGLLRHDPSPRWKQVVEPRPGRFVHHLELRSPADIDSEVLGWLREAWEQAA